MDDWYRPQGKNLIIEAFLVMNRFHPHILAEEVTRVFIGNQEWDLLQKWVELTVASGNGMLLREIQKTIVTYPQLDRANDLLVKIGRASCGRKYPFKDLIIGDFLAKRQYKYVLQMLHPIANKLGPDLYDWCYMGAPEANIERFKLAKTCMDAGDLDTAAQCFLDIQQVDGWQSCRNNDNNRYRDSKVVHEAPRLALQVMVQLSERGLVERARQLAPHANVLGYTPAPTYAEAMASYYRDQNLQDKAFQIARSEKSAAAIQIILRPLTGIYQPNYVPDLTKYDTAMEIIQSIPNWQRDERCKQTVHSIISYGMQEGRVAKGLEDMKLFTWSPTDLLYFVFRLQDAKDLVNAKALLQTIPAIPKEQEWDQMEERRLRLRQELELDKPLVLNQQNQS